jgi:putative phage-type endonuclease
MKIIDCKQGTDDWFEARLGIITASTFDKIITKAGKRSSQVDEMVNRAIAELIVGEPDETFQSEAMLRGKELEDQALKFFNFTKGYDFKPVGFVDSELGFGASPDGLDQEIKLGLELKCPSAHTHLAYLAADKLPDKYKQQVQGALLVTGYDKWVFGSYHPSLPCFSVEVERDNEFIEAMRKILVECGEAVRDGHAKLKAMVEAS